MCHEDDDEMRLQRSYICVESSTQLYGNSVKNSEFWPARHRGKFVRIARKILVRFLAVVG